MWVNLLQYSKTFVPSIAAMEKNILLSFSQFEGGSVNAETTGLQWSLMKNSKSKNILQENTIHK